MHLRPKSPRSRKDSEVMATKDPRIYKVVVIGEGGVGKSAVTMQYVSNVFLDFHDPTIEDAYQAQAVIDGEVGILDILDTAGQEELQTAMKEQYMRQGEGYIGVYSINDLHSFQRLRAHIQSLKRLRNFDRVPLVIVGNKLDLFNERCVSTMEGISLAREFDCPFYEASAANRINIEDIFNGLIRQIRKKKDEVDTNLSNKKPKLKRFKKFLTKKFHGSLNHLNILSS